MKKRLFVFSFVIFLSLTFLLSGCCAPDPLVLNPKVYSQNLATFSINVGGASIPDRDDANYKDYAECDFTYTYQEEEIIDNEARVRIRGTSSRWFDKKGYKLKLVEKTSLCGLPENKKYNLLASYLDPCKLRDYLALSISYTMNSKSDRYAPKPVLVKLELDGQDYGLYYLTDDIATGNGRIPFDDYAETDIEIPFLLEMDTIAYREGVLGKDYFALGVTDVFDYNKSDDLEGTALLYKLDTPEDVTAEQFNYIQSYITECRQSLVNKDLNKFSSMVDVNAFIDYFMLGELFRNTDMAGRSVYMYRSSTDGKLIFGPSWDFDYTCSRPYQLAPNTDYTLTNAKDRFYNYDWWKLFLEIPQAKQLIKDRYTNYLRPIYNYEIAEAKLFYEFYEAEIKQDASIWYSEDTNDTDKLVEDNFAWTCEYFRLRMEMMDELFM